MRVTASCKLVRCLDYYAPLKLDYWFSDCFSAIILLNNYFYCSLARQECFFRNSLITNILIRSFSPFLHENGLLLCSRRRRYCAVHAAVSSPSQEQHCKRMTDKGLFSVLAAASKSGNHDVRELGHLY